MGKLFRSNLKVCMTAILLFFAVAVNAQNTTVRGNVTDQTGEPVIGATVKVVGTSTGVITDIDGNYTVSVPANGSLEFSYVGCKTQKVDVAGKSVVNVALVTDAQQVDEVVVTALGIKKDAKKLGYAVSTVGSDDLTRTGSTNLAAGLYGKASGVRINAAPGGGTSAVSISVRGLSSITGNTQPLLVMDGVPIHNGNTNNNDYWGNQRINSNGFVDINPEDIENISILKGAAASALYGSEAANGVIMITTKKGKEGSGTKVDFSATVSMDKVAYMPEIQKEYGPGYDGWAIGYDDATALSGFQETKLDRNGNTIVTQNNGNRYAYGPSYADGQAWLTKNNKKLTWIDGKTHAYEAQDHNQWADIFRTGWNQTYNLALTNTTDRNSIRFSYTYNNAQAMQYNSNNNKHNFNLNGTFDITKNKALQLNYTATYQTQYIHNRAYRISRLTNNYSGMFNGFQDMAWYREHSITSLGYKNSISSANGGTANSLTPDEQLLYSDGTSSIIDEYFWKIFGCSQDERHQRFIGSVNPTWQIIPEVRVSARIATDLTVDKIENKNGAENSHIYDTNGQHSDSYGLQNSQYSIVYGDVMASFNKTFAEKHDLSVNVGWNARQETYWLSSVSTSQGLTQENWFHLNASVGTKNASMTKQDLLKTGMFATLSYGFNNWGYLEGTIRQEKTSTLKSGNNSFWYPSVSASVVYTTLLGNACPKWWDYGKIRGSFGIVGNAPDVYYANNAFDQGTLNRSTTFTYNYISTSIGNENIKPERKQEFEIGLENKFFNNRLGFELSYYYNDIKDQILTTTAAASMGAQSMLMNVGELENKGVEFSVYGTPIQTKDWRWDLRANLAWNKNKVKKLADGLDVLKHYETDGAVDLESHVGESMGDWYAYTYQTDANGNYIVGDDGFYVLDKTERHKVGNAMPKMTGGFGTSLSWKNLTLDVTFDFRIGGDVLNLPWQYMMDVGNIEDAVGVRDAATGGIYYYNDGTKNVRVDAPANYQRGVTQVNGHYVWDNGIIQEGVKADGSKNDIIVTQFGINDTQYGWGSSTMSYADAIQKNTYLKCREISLGYTFPKNWTRKFYCDNITLSAFARNPFYVYRSLKDFDAEATDGTNWIYQSVLGGSTASCRTFGLSLRASFSGAAPSKKAEVATKAPETKYIDKIVEKVVEKPVVKEVVKEVATAQTYVATFAQNSDKLDESQLANVAAGTSVEIVAYASPEGNAKYNEALSQRRADAVAKYLEAKGVKVVRTVAKGADSNHANRIAIVTVK